MARTKTVVEEPQGVEETKKGVYVVVDELGNERRIFSDKVHGKEAKDLADSFAKKFKLKVK